LDAIGAADAAILDRCQIGAVELAKADLLRGFAGRIKADRDGDETEADVALPDRSGHDPSVPQQRWSIPNTKATRKRGQSSRLATGNLSRRGYFDAGRTQSPDTRRRVGSNAAAPLRPRTQHDPRPPAPRPHQRPFVTGRLLPERRRVIGDPRRSHASG